MRHIPTRAHPGSPTLTLKGPGKARQPRWLFPGFSALGFCRVWREAQTPTVALRFRENCCHRCHCCHLSAFRAFLSGSVGVTG